MDKLYIIMPAYNEEANVENVVKDWHRVVEKVGNGARLLIVDDGSKDNTYAMLQQLQEKYPYLEVETKENGGHGSAVIYGYRKALERGADYIFQTDSDGQTVPGEFYAFWRNRKKYDVIIGKRTRRQDGISRVFVTKVLKLVLFVVFGKSIPDANTPFRLMERKALAESLERLPESTNLPNILLSVLFVHRRYRVAFVPITFKPRQGGVNSINLKKITPIGLKAVKDFYDFKKNRMDR